VTGGILLGYFVNLGCAEFTFGWRIYKEVCLSAITGLDYGN